jgi:hypothetical protein
MISKNNAEVLCRTAWQDATNNKETNIDDWIKTTFVTKFNEVKKYPSVYAYITREDAELLCRVAWWDVRVNSDVYPRVQEWLNRDFLARINAIKKNITKTFSTSPITHVYVIVYEDAVYGTWTTPEIAVKFFFKDELAESKGIDLRQDKLFTAKEAVEKMLNTSTDYPRLTKIKINPSNSRIMWVLPR